MKKLTILILFILVSCGEGNTQRTRCNGEVKNNNDTVTKTELCLDLLPVTYGKTDPVDQKLFDRLLISCLLYNVEMWKCEKKSNVLPP